MLAPLTPHGLRMRSVSLSASGLGWQFFQPWNNALRGLNDKHEDDKGAGIEQWATCIAVLFVAVIKLSNVPSKDPVRRATGFFFFKEVGCERVLDSSA